MKRNINLTCLSVAELREQNKPLPADLASHANSCHDCNSIAQIDGLLKHYVPPEMKFYSANTLWKKIEAKKRPEVFWSPRLAWAAVMILLLIGSLVMIRLSLSPPQPAGTITASIPRPASLPACRVVEMRSAVVIQEPGDFSWKNLSVADSLKTGDRIKVAPGGRLAFAYPGHTEVTLEGNSLARIDSISKQNHNEDSFYLYKGRAFIHHEQNAFVIHTPLATLHAIGTTFSVRQENTSTQIRVFQGEVHVQTNRGEGSVRADQVLFVRPASKSSMQTFPLKQVSSWEQAGMQRYKLWTSKQKNSLKIEPEPLEDLRIERTENAIPQVDERQRQRAEKLFKKEQLYQRKETQKIEGGVYNRTQKYDEHLKRLEKKQEEEIRRKDDEIHQQQDQLLKNR